MKWIREIGPGILIAAAFIGPGTVTLCTIAGVSYGYSLIWALVLSIFAWGQNFAFNPSKKGIAFEIISIES